MRLVIPSFLHPADCVGFVVGSSPYHSYACVAFFLPLCYPFECSLV